LSPATSVAHCCTLFPTQPISVRRKSLLPCSRCCISEGIPRYGEPEFARRIFGRFQQANGCGVAPFVDFPGALGRVKPSLAALAADAGLTRPARSQGLAISGATRNTRATASSSL
jgi:hypothetical protein